MRFDKSSLLLYAVTDRHWLGNRSLVGVVKESLDGGVTFVQLREKDLDHDRFLREARYIKNICHDYHVPFVVNDNIEIAMEVDADGVHVGQSDMEVSEVRKLLGPKKIIGVSAQTVEQAIAAWKGGATYLGVGAVFPTGSKEDAEAVSLTTLKEICASVSIPVVAIGGITLENIKELAGTGIDGIAVISAIYAQENIREASEKLKEEVKKL